MKRTLIVNYIRIQFVIIIAVFGILIFSNRCFLSENVSAQKNYKNDFHDVFNTVYEYSLSDGKEIKFRGPIDVGRYSTPTFADLDNDGDFDLIVAESIGKLNYYRNTGNREIPEWKEDTKMFLEINLFGQCAPTFADLDNDGDYDLITGEQRGYIKYYENTGTQEKPEWTFNNNMFSGIDVGNYSKPTFADLDDDKDFDLTIGVGETGNRKLYYFENTGTPKIPEWTENNTFFSGIIGLEDMCPAFEDLDNDGDLDLTIGYRWGSLVYYENTGTSVDPKWTKNNIMFNEINDKFHENHVPTFVDIDYDNDFDLIFGVKSGILFYYENTGNEEEPIWKKDNCIFSNIRVRVEFSPTFIDFDKDSDFDLIIGEHSGELFYYENTGTTEKPEWTTDSTIFSDINLDFNSAPTFADLDNDGDFDLTIGEVGGKLFYYENTGTSEKPEWTKNNTMFPGIDIGTYSTPIFIDLDNDMDFDLIIGEHFGNIFYYENTGSDETPEWTEASSMFSDIDVELFSAPSLTDLDDDGDFDLILGNGDGFLTYYENIGNLNNPKWTKDSSIFSEINIGSDSKPTFADLDNDSDFDLIIGDGDGILEFYECLVVDNSVPKVDDLSISDSQVFRTNSIILIADGSDNENAESKLIPLFQYKSPKGNWQSDWISNINYNQNSGHWEANFTPIIEAEIGVYDFRVKFIDQNSSESSWLTKNDLVVVKNSLPTVNFFSSSESQIYRTYSITLITEGSDKEDEKSKLNATFEYKSPNGKWKDDMIYNINYKTSSGQWEATFNPPKDAELGKYDFRVRLIDLIGGEGLWFEFQNLIEILNNPPIVESLKFSKKSIDRADSLVVYTNGSDKENREYDLTCQIQFKSPSGIWTDLNDEIFKNDHWETIFKPLQNAEIGKYDFRVKVIDMDDSESKWHNELQKVDVQGNHKPIVTLISPKNNSILKTTSPILSWDVYDEDKDVLNFSICVYNNLEEVKLTNYTTSDTSYKLKNLSDKMIYGWEVLPYDGKEQGICESGRWYFTVNLSYGDLIPPVIGDITIQNPFIGEDITIIANVTDNIKVNSVKLYYRNIDETNYKEILMDKKYENNYTATIQNTEITGKEIEYYLLASDGINNSTEPLEFPKDYPKNFSIIENKPDLKISENDIKFPEDYPEIGEEITITVTVHNIGNSSAIFFDVDLYLDNEFLNNESVMVLLKNEKTELKFRWTATEGSHTFLVKIDEKNTIKELNESNNNASNTLNIVSTEMSISGTDDSKERFILLQFLLYNIFILPILNIVFLVLGIVILKKKTKSSKKNKVGIVLIIIGLVIGFIVIGYGMFIANSPTEFEEWTKDGNRQPGDSITVIGKIDSVNITTIGEESLFLYYFIDSDVPIASSEDIGSKGDYKVVIIETDELGIPNIAGSYKINICNSLILFLGIIGFGLAIAGFGKAVEVPKETKEKEGKPEETKVEEGIDEDELESYEEEKKVLKKKKCPNCGSTIEITTDKRPLNIRCPNCNKGFKLKAKVEEGITEIVVCSKCGKSVPVFGNANMVNCKCGNNIMVEE